MRFSTVIMAVLVSHLVWVSSPTADDFINPDVDIIKSLRMISNEALTAHNLEKFSSFFDDDYIINYGSSVKTLSRAAEIKSLEEAFVANPEMDYLRTPESIYISKSQPLAMEHGIWRGGPDKNTIYSGRYTAGWRKTKGVWKLHNELFVTLNCEGINC